MRTASSGARAYQPGFSTVLYESGIPFVCLSSGSVSAAGAISGITALRIAYPNAYCYFPANILATTIAAGWYYCTFSTTTAGTAFLNTYSTDMPLVPASPTAVVDGKGAFTGVTTEIFGPTITVPAGAMGVSGALDWFLDTSFTNSVGSKTTNVRFSGNAGTVFSTLSLTTQLGTFYNGRISNRGAANVQIGTFASIDYGQVVRDSTPVAGAIDTTVATTLVIGSLRNTATDNFVIESASIGIRRALTNG